MTTFAMLSNMLYLAISNVKKDCKKTLKLQLVLLKAVDFGVLKPIHITFVSL